MPSTKWEQKSVELFQKLLKKYHSLSDMEYDELQTIGAMIHRGSNSFKSPPLAAEAKYLLARFYSLEQNTQFLEYAKASYRQGELRCGLLLLDHELRTQPIPPLFSRMEQLHLIQGLEKSEEPFIVSLLIDIKLKIPPPSPEERVIINPDLQYQWFAQTILAEVVHSYFEPFLHPEKFSLLLETLINSDLDAFLKLVKPEMTSPQVEREWGKFKFYLETNMGDAKNLLMVFMPVMNNVFKQMLVSPEEKAHCLMQTLQKIPDSILPNLRDRMAIFQTFIPEPSSLLAFHHIMYRPDHEHLKQVGAHKVNTQELIKFLSSDSCHTLNFILQAGFYLADPKKIPAFKLANIQKDFFEEDYGFAIIKIYEHIAQAMGRDETVLVNGVLNKLGSNTPSEEVLVTINYVLAKKKQGSQESISELIEKRPELSTLEKATDPDKNAQWLMYIKAKKFEKKGFTASPEEQAKQEDLRRVYQTVAAEQFIDKYLDIERVDRVSRKILGREIHNKREAFEAIDQIYSLKNNEMLALYQAFMLTSAEYQKKDIEPRTSRDGVAFTKLRDEVSKLLQDSNGSSLSTYSMNPGILRAHQPTYLDWRFQAALRNKVVDINSPDADEAGFSKQPGAGPVTASISGHAYFLIAAMVKTYKIKTELEDETFEDLVHFVRAAVAFYVMQGYHNFAEMMVPMVKDPMIQRALTGKPFKDPEEHQDDSEEELDIEAVDDEEEVEDESELEEEQSDSESSQTLADLFSPSHLEFPKDILQTAMHETIKLDSLSRARAQVHEEIHQHHESFSL